MKMLNKQHAQLLFRSFILPLSFYKSELKHEIAVSSFWSGTEERRCLIRWRAKDFNCLIQCCCGELSTLRKTGTELPWGKPAPRWDMNGPYSAVTYNDSLFLETDLSRVWLGISKQLFLRFSIELVSCSYTHDIYVQMKLFLYFFAISKVFATPFLFDSFNLNNNVNSIDMTDSSIEIGNAEIAECPPDSNRSAVDEENDESASLVSRQTHACPNTLMKAPTTSKAYGPDRLWRAPKSLPKFRYVFPSRHPGLEDPYCAHYHRVYNKKLTCSGPEILYGKDIAYVLNCDIGMHSNLLLFLDSVLILQSNSGSLLAIEPRGPKAHVAEYCCLAFWDSVSCILWQAPYFAVDHSLILSRTLSIWDTTVYGILKESTSRSGIIWNSINGWMMECRE